MSHNWAEARAGLHVIQIIWTSLRNYEDDNPGWTASTFAPFFAANPHIEFCLNVGTLTFKTCREAEGTNMEAALDADLDQMEELIGLGVPLNYIMLQSTFSKVNDVWTEGNPCQPDYTLQQRIDDTIWYLSGVKTRFPTRDFTIILGDALIAKGPAWVGTNLGLSTAMAAWKEGFAQIEAEGLRIHVVQHDIQWDNIDELSPGAVSNIGYLARACDWLVRNGYGIGYFVSSNSAANDQEYYDRTLAVYDLFKTAGLPQSGKLVGSFHPVPASELPETGDYPLTRVLRDVIRAG